MPENAMEFHPIANVFPLLEGQRFRELVEDVRVHGLRDPIVLFDGAILDGRNRYRACCAAQVAATFETYRGKDPIAYVVSVNLHRRHLDASQRAMIAAEIASLRGHGGRPRKEGRRDRGGRLIYRELLHPERARANAGKFVSVSKQSLSPKQAGDLLQVSETSVRDAMEIKAKGVPELASAVRKGEAAVDAAKEVARLPKEQQSRIMGSGDPSAVRAIGGRAKSERLRARREKRAAEAASSHAVFDHLKIGDGRAIGNVRIGEARALAGSLQIVVDVLLAAAGHIANADHGARIRDCVGESAFSKMIEWAVQRRSVA